MKKLSYLYLIILLLYLSVSHTGVFAAQTSGAQAEIKARLAEKFNLRIFGYTAPSALVQVLGIRVFAQGSSDKTGYFLINDVPVSGEAKEICITTIDSERRVGFPLCISLPDTNKPKEIGPLLLSPTLSLSEGTIWQNQKAAASGRTIPNETVYVSFFEVLPASISDRVAARLQKIFHPTALAFDLPLLAISSDEKGAFSFNLPSSKAVGYRLYAKSEYKGNPTPKSSTLSFLIGAYASYFLLYILPWLVFLIILALVVAAMIWYERKTHVFSFYAEQFTEKKLRPIGVQLRLQLRHGSYRFREFLKSYRK